MVSRLEINVDNTFSESNTLFTMIQRIFIYHFLTQISTFNDGSIPIRRSKNCEENANMCPYECEWQSWNGDLEEWQIDNSMQFFCEGICNICLTGTAVETYCLICF